MISDLILKKPPFEIWQCKKCGRKGLTRFFEHATTAYSAPIYWCSNHSNRIARGKDKVRFMVMFNADLQNQLSGMGKNYRERLWKK